MLRVYLLATERVRKTASTIGFLRLRFFRARFLLVINLAMGTSLAVPSDVRGRLWLGLADSQLEATCIDLCDGASAATVTSVSLLSQVPLTALLAALLLHER